MLSLSFLATLPFLLTQAASLPSSPDQATSESLPPFLVPGSGWSAPTAAIVRPGFFAELTAIAHWTRMDHQILWRERDDHFQVGVLAYHRSQIDRVEFAVDNGGWKTRREPDVSPQTGYQEYGVRLRTDDFPPGWHEIRARVVPRQAVEGGGTDRILVFKFFAGQHMVPGLHFGERWVDSVNGSDVAAGTRSDPFGSFAHAVNDLAASPTGADGARIHLFGQSTIIPVGGTIAPVNNDLPLTVRSVGGQRPYFAPKSGGGPEKLPIRHLRFEHLRFDISWNEMFQSGTLQDQAHLYFMGCEFRGHTVPRQNPPGSTPTVFRLTGLFDYNQGRNIWMADCQMTEIDGACHSFVGWMRGVHITRGLIGGFGGSQCIIDCSVRGSPETQNFSTNAMWVGSWGGVKSPVTNVLVDGLRVFDHTGELLNITESCNGIAVVNCLFDGVNGAAFSQSRVGSVFQGEQRHILLLHCTSPQRLEIDYPSNYLFEHMLGGWLTGSIFGDVFDRQQLGSPINANMGGNPANNGFSGTVAGLQLDVRNMHVHGNRPAWSHWTLQGYAPTYVDIWNNKLRVRSTANANLTILPADRVLKHDCQGCLRGDATGMTTVGSRVGQGE